jgi:hypothetical protein
LEGDITFLHLPSQQHLTWFIQGGNHSKAQILGIQGIPHRIPKKRKITIWNPNDEGKENENIVETSGH